MNSNVFVVILSGRPCVGKSSFCKIFHEHLGDRGIVEIISHDDAAYAICDRHNNSDAGEKNDAARDVLRQSSTSDVSGLPSGAVTYDNVWDQFRDEIMELYKQRILNAVTEKELSLRPRVSVIVLDSVYLDAASRSEVLELLRANREGVKVCCVSFEVQDEDNYARVLDARNADRKNKKITTDYVKTFLLHNASPVSTSEPFDHIVRCRAVLEDGWKESQIEAVTNILSVVLLPSEDGGATTTSAVTTVSCQGSGARPSLKRQNTDFFETFLLEENKGMQTFWEIELSSALSSSSPSSSSTPNVPSSTSSLKRAPSTHHAKRLLSRGFSSRKVTETVSMSRQASEFNTGPARVMELAQIERVHDMFRHYLLQKHLPSEEQVDELLDFMSLKYGESLADSSPLVSASSATDDNDDSAVAAAQLHHVYKDVTDARDFLVKKGWVNVTGPSKAVAHEANKGDKVSNLFLEMLKKSLPQGTGHIKTYVDIGCGNGVTTSHIVRSLGISPAMAHGFDIGQSMGAIAKEHFQLHFFDGRHLTELASESVDLLSMVHVLHHTGANQEQLLREVARVLKPKGLFIMKEHDSPDSDYDLYLNLVHTCKQKLFYPDEEEHMPLGIYHSSEEWVQTIAAAAGLHVMKQGYEERNRLNARNTDLYNSYIEIFQRDTDDTDDRAEQDTKKRKISP